MSVFQFKRGGDMNTNVKLKEMRMQRGMTQIQVAQKANIAERSYQNYEAGERTPNVHTAQLIAQALNTTVEELFPVALHS